MAATPLDYLGTIPGMPPVCGGHLYRGTGAGLAGMDAPRVLACCCILSLRATSHRQWGNAVEVRFFSGFGLERKGSLFWNAFHWSCARE